MTDFIDLMLNPFLACLILTGMHAYLGLHVLDRGVIFVDLALAQVAAFGATVAFLGGLALHSGGSYYVSLGVAVIAAFVFSTLRPKTPKVSIEAIIGVVYVVAAAGCVLVLSTMPEGGEELKSLLVGHLLFVKREELVWTGAVYSVLALVHFFFRHQIFRASALAATNEPAPDQLRWNFIFYLSFALVITSSVEMAGILLVFTYLVVPSLCGLILGSTITQRLLIGWSIGIVGSVLGIYWSWVSDLPTGAAIVCAFGGIFLVVFLLFDRRNA